MTIEEGITQSFQDNIDRGEITVTDNFDSISVFVKPPSAFKVPYDQKEIKQYLKAYGFDFNGTGTHTKAKRLHQGTNLIKRKYIKDINSFTRMYLDGNVDDNGNIDLDVILRHTKEMSESFNNDYQYLQKFNV